MIGRRTIAVPAIIALMMFSGCAAGVMMKAPNSLERPGDSDATVYFYRNRIYFGDGRTYNVWDGEKLVGVLAAGSYIPYHTSPGEHVFMAHFENWSYLKATLAPGQRYYVNGQLYPGFVQARVMLLPVTKKNPEDFDKAAARLNDMNPTMVRPEDEEGYVAPRREDVRRALEAFQAGKVESTTLAPEDHD